MTLSASFEWLERDNPKWKDTEDIYQRALKEKDWNTVWLCVNRICTATVKKILSKARSQYGVEVEQDVIYDYAMDSTVKVMHYIKDNGTIPAKLTSYCFLPCYGTVHGHKSVKWDQTYSLDEYLENELESEEIYNNEED